MTAEELLDLYAAGERDFSNAIIENAQFVECVFDDTIWIDGEIINSCI